MADRELKTIAAEHRAAWVAGEYKAASLLLREAQAQNDSIRQRGDGALIAGVGETGNVDAPGAVALDA